MRPSYRIPFRSENALITALNDLEGYNKFMSVLYLCYLGLPTLPGVIVTNGSGFSAVQSYFANRGETHVLLRTDSRDETGVYPRGGNLIKITRILRESRKYLANGRILLLLAPRSRYDNLYSINALFTPDTDKIYLEIVGAGFDASDLNRGDISPHETIQIFSRDQPEGGANCCRFNTLSPFS